MNARPLIVLSTTELIDRVESSFDDYESLSACVHEIQFRKKARSKLEELNIRAQKHLKELKSSKNKTNNSSTLHTEPENPQLEDEFEHDIFTQEECTAFVRILVGFSMLDRDFSDEEMEFIEATLDNYNIPNSILDQSMEASVGQDPRALCEKELTRLRNLDPIKKEEILTTLHELSLSDGLFHLDEKAFLEDVKKFWGLKVTFGKGELIWTENQELVVTAPKDDRIVINAPPGSGKTAVACARISHLIDAGVPPSNIWLLSFTRTAVQELRDRIANFSEFEDDILGLRIATLDSRAWQIRYNLRDDGTTNLFGGYEKGIEQALELLEQKQETFEEFFEDLGHVVIDEAQDVTGVRKKFVEKILGLLPRSCGITIFGDRAQAIYGFTNENEHEQVSDNSNFLTDIIKTKKFEYFELEEIHRTDDKKLIDLIDKLRLEIQVDDESDVISPEETTKEIEAAASAKDFRFNPSELKGANNTLVLFRRRSDVLQAMNFASAEKIPFRLRMSALPHVARPWIGQVLSEFHESTISQKEFEALFEEKTKECPPSYETSFSASKRLMDACGRSGRINLDKLRTLMSQSPPPVNLCLPDLGSEGPILGTIHSSKGRQAENVTMFLPVTMYSSEEATKMAEETRVLFVGASRARSTLNIGRSFRRFPDRLDNGRIFQRTKAKHKNQIEIGRADDYDQFSIVRSSRLDETTALALQNFLNSRVSSEIIEVYAESNRSENFVYDLYAKNGSQNIWIGSMTNGLNHDFFKIKKIKKLKRNRGLPRKINYLHMIGIRTVGVTEEHPFYDSILPYFRKSQIWNIPIIIGYPALQL